MNEVAISSRTGVVIKAVSSQDYVQGDWKEGGGGRKRPIGFFGE